MTSLKRKIRSDADDGDTIAASALRDMALDDGLRVAEPLKRGKWVCVWTVTYFWVGPINDDNDQYLCLDAPSQIFETGPLNEFFAGKANMAERTIGVHRIRHGAVVNVSDWPHEDYPTSKQ